MDGNDTLDSMTSSADGGWPLGSQWRTTVQAYHDIMEHYSDKRVKNWFLMSGPMPTAVACTIYVISMKVIGPRVMKNRKPYDLTKSMIIYNIFQMLFNLWILSSGIGHWLFEYSFSCQPVDYSNSPGAVKMLHAAWWFYFSKFVDWFDTLFFVMRKKFQHLSLLHLVHHGLMPFSVWWGVKFCGGGQSTFFGLLNTQIHVIMYLYYSLAALGPKYQKYLWWKKYLTTIQMIQFLLVLLHALQLFFIECSYPKIFVYAIIVHAILFIGLFSDFYIKTYVRHPKKLKEKDENCNGSSKHLNGTSSGAETNGKAATNGTLRKRVANGSNHTAANGHTKNEEIAESVTSSRHNGMCIQQAFYDTL